MSTQPIRLEATFRSVHALVGEYARTLAKGGTTLRARRAVATGSRFRVALATPEADEVLELDGRVVDVMPTDAGFEIGVAYERVMDQRAALDKMISRIEIDPTYDTLRAHPRIPVALVAQVSGGSVTIRDLSRGGMQIDRAMPVGTRVEMFVALALRTTKVTGTVVWSRGSRAGVQFDTLDPYSTTLVDGLLRLLRPERIELTFQPLRLARDSGGYPTASVAQGLFEDAMRAQLSCLGSLVVDTTNSSDELGAACAARVAIAGDHDIELQLTSTVEVGAQLARHLIGDDAELGDDEIGDALAETLVAIAGVACDRLECATGVLEVSPPLSGPIEEQHGDLTETLVLRSSHGVIRLAMVLRDR